MGARRRAGEAVLVAAVLCAAVRAGASVQVEPIARLSLEGGYDSNVLYNGQGGAAMGRASPDLGVQLRNHTWSFLAVAGGDLLDYQHKTSSPVWNQRGRLLLRARPSERWRVDGGLDATYAFDPIGLARLGIFNHPGAALIGNASVRTTWRTSHDWDLSGTLSEHLVRFDDATGAASHTPGVELTRRLSPRLDVGGAYRFDYFQGLGPGSQDALAHELQAIARWRMSRSETLEAQLGPTAFTSPAGASYVLPQGYVQLASHWRRGDARISYRHGLGLGLNARPGLFDAVEGGITARLGTHFLVHADGGVWRSGSIPWGSNAVLGYGVQGTIDYRLANGLLVGVTASRFARLDVSAPQFDRTILGLHVGWELRRRTRGEP